jgi:hypothetical protein
MLATWMMEIYLSKCNTLEDIVAAESAMSDVESLTVERSMMEEDMRNFMTTYQVRTHAAAAFEARWLISAERPRAKGGLRIDLEPRQDGPLLVLRKLEQGSREGGRVLGDRGGVAQGHRCVESPGTCSPHWVVLPC